MESARIFSAQKGFYFNAGFRTHSINFYTKVPQSGEELVHTFFITHFITHYFFKIFRISTELEEIASGKIKWLPISFCEFKLARVVTGRIVQIATGTAGSLAALIGLVLRFLSARWCAPSIGVANRFFYIFS